MQMKIVAVDLKYYLLATGLELMRAVTVMVRQQLKKIVTQHVSPHLSMMACI